MILSRVPVAPTCRGLLSRCRPVSTLSSNSHVKTFPHTAPHGGYLLTYLDTNPPTPRLAIGASTQLPPTPQSFTENHEFISILNRVLREYAAQDPGLQSQAQAFAGPGGAVFGSHGAFSPQQRATRKNTAGLGTSHSIETGFGGHVHLSDLRNPPDFGRIAFPEDILGSIEVDGHGKIIGTFEPSGTYRILTNEGILGLSDFLRTKLIEELKEEEKRR
ncbi:hypothetical protein F5B22DRAFT_610930 [Xylaria bambusicola]|uniref:uncharacterized protein n=1 Tax=Xylaria bambusicola TaxID=326684 RepID=UPI0020089EFC|nr:uncharacterized protein F5B22DRAFT_610930 [Xylaria bambusicola]KAI0514562.1 hypothetical protein F5B22DRAFT_610930 [Xylaria bambusicola]